jgi:hypothetical protein
MSKVPAKDLTSSSRLPRLIRHNKQIKALLSNKFKTLLSKNVAIA